MKPMSIKGRMTHVMLRYRHLFKGTLKREVIDKSTSIQELGRDSDKADASFAKIPEGIQFIESGYQPFYAEWVVPVAAEEDKLVLMLEQKKTVVIFSLVK
jgi:monoterpene epsilon-lactone hydrolase